MASKSTRTTNGMSDSKQRHVSNIHIGGGASPPRKRSSHSIQAPATSAWGGDERHFDVSITDENPESASPRTKQNNGLAALEECELDPKFGTTTLSSAKVSDQLLKVLQDSTVVHEAVGNGKDNDDHRSSGRHSTASDNSTEQSDEPSITRSHDSGDSIVPSSWTSFAQSLFTVKGSSSYCCAALPLPLLPKYEKADHLASLASWVTILRIMGDLPDIDTVDKIDVAGQSTPPTVQVRQFYHKKYTKKDVDDSHKKYTELFKNPGFTEAKGLPFLSDSSASMLEKVQFICALGIYQPDIRDELYCQVCKQLTNNPSRNSTVRGWVLLYLMAGSFSPTERFSPCFLQFLQESMPEHANRVERLLRRTFITGTRAFPPSWLEFQAAKNGKPILLPVALMNGNRMLVEADAVTTVQELSRQVGNRIGLHHLEGFSLYITLMQRISCLGHGLHRVMDAVSECEQHTRQMGMKESTSTWRLYFRKEYFTPWHEHNRDPISIDLVYQQVMRGVSVGEYNCDKEEVLVMMAAQRYFVEHGNDLKPEKIESFLTSWLPGEKKMGDELQSWVGKVTQVLEKDILKSKINADTLKADVVTFAKNKWFSMFSRFYDASKIQGPDTSWSHVILGLNFKGIQVMDEKENIKMQIPFIETASISRNRHTTTISTVKSEEYVIFSLHSEDLYRLLSMFLEGLKRKSKYGFVVQDCSQYDGAIGLSVQKGDLVKLDHPYDDLKKADVFTGTCQRTGKSETMPRDLLYILPVIEQPTKDMMGMVTVQLRKEFNPFITLVNTENKKEEHNLLNFSKHHFRSSNENRMSKILSKASFKKDKSTQLWKFSKEPLKKPLLKKTCNREELRQTSCRCFLAIQQFMGDSPNKDQISDFELANNCVLEPSMRSRHMREEVYCQLIKQLTHNPDKTSEDRGWQLLVHMSSTVIPGSDLVEECELFMKGSLHRMAAPCLDRFQTTKRNGYRQYPPHQKEYELLRSNERTIKFDVVLPFNERQSVEVETTSRVFDIKQQLLTKFDLVDAAMEYGLFFALRDRGPQYSSTHSKTMLGAYDGDYFMDALCHVERFWTKLAHSGRVSQASPEPPPEPHVFFMKKIWVNAEPGQHRMADSMFHFPQELPNYLRGFHKFSNVDLARMAAYIYRGQFGEDLAGMINFHENINALIPRSHAKTKSVDEWRKAVETNLKLTKDLSPDKAKVEFLKTIWAWPTYGSVFFEVKQRMMKTMPKHLLLAVNPNGVLLLDPESKDILANYEYGKIPNWAFDEFSFTLVVGESSNATKIFFETSVGHNIDDVVMSYVAWTMNTHIKKRPKYAGVTVGESSC
ncbi:myosin-VIIa-like isoform X3 [Mizuhopecten yessoensis]|uniref:myosin-VIIa-like isoform X3 n=1 Tax=Mizuhopecten yessoensis TaxID=6573 RepID=UPI000B45A439|nr:myosin-VIIa-like isoform X3 [Mizuhopecten yessoensis]